MKPTIQVARLLALRALLKNPPDGYRLLRGYQTADQRRAEDQWERQLDRLRDAWHQHQLKLRHASDPLVIEVVIAALLESGDESDSAYRAGQELALAWSEWQAKRAGKPLTMEAQATAA